MPTVETSGTLAVDGSEQTLATVTDNRTLMLVADLSGMANGDRVVLRSKRKVLTGSAAHIEVQEREFNDVQDGAAFLDPIPSPHSCQFTLERTAGTVTNIEWSIESL